MYDKGYLKNYKIRGALGLHLKICRVFGVAPLKFTASGVKVSKSYSVYSFVIISILNAIVIAGFCMDFNLDHSIHGETVTSRIVWTSNIVLGTVITCVGAYGAPNRLHDVISALNKIEKVKCQVKGANQDHTEKKHIISLLAYLGMVTVLIIADLYKDTCEEIEFGHHVNLIVMNSFFSLEYFVHELIVIQFTLIAAQVQHIFVEVNEKLQDIKDNLDKQQGSFEPPREIKNKNINSVIDSLYLKDTEKDFNRDYKTIRSLAHSYEAICDIVEKIGCSHKVLNLCLLTSSFLHLVVTPYYDIFTNIYALIRKPSVLLIRIVWFYVHLFNLGLLVEPWHQIQVQNLRTRVLVGHLFRRVQNNSKLYDELEVFYKVLLLKNPVYSPFGLCVLDRSLIVTIMGAVTTYLVIIFQFRS